MLTAEQKMDEGDLMSITARKISRKLALSTAALALAAGMAAGTVESANAAPAKTTQVTAGAWKTYGWFPSLNACHAVGIQGKRDGRWSTYWCHYVDNAPNPGWPAQLDYQR
ncbi:MAG: hypothetical protein ACRDP3_22295, partial [Streptomyces sp.]